MTENPIPPAPPAATPAAPATTGTPSAADQARAIVAKLTLGGRQVDVSQERLVELAQRGAQLEQERAGLERDRGLMDQARRLAGFAAANPTHGQLLQEVVRSASRGDDVTQLVTALRSGQRVVASATAPAAPPPSTGTPPAGAPASQPPPTVSTQPPGSDGTPEIAALMAEMAQIRSEFRQRDQTDRSQRLAADVQRVIAARPTLSLNDDAQEAGRTLVMSLLASDQRGELTPETAADIAESMLSRVRQADLETERRERLGRQNLVGVPGSAGTPEVARPAAPKFTAEQMRLGEVKKAVRGLLQSHGFAGDGFGIPRTRN